MYGGDITLTALMAFSFSLMVRFSLREYHQRKEKAGRPFSLLAGQTNLSIGILRVQDFYSRGLAHFFLARLSIFPNTVWSEPFQPAAPHTLLHLSRCRACECWSYFGLLFPFFSSGVNRAFSFLRACGRKVAKRRDESTTTPKETREMTIATYERDGFGWEKTEGWMIDWPGWFSFLPLYFFFSPSSPPPAYCCFCKCCDFLLLFSPLRCSLLTCTQELEIIMQGSKKFQTCRKPVMRDT